jgi:hypothetical protein
MTMGKVVFGALMGSLATAGACILYGVPSEPLSTAAEKRIRQLELAVEKQTRVLERIESRQYRPHSAEADAARRAALGAPVAIPPAFLPPELPVIDLLPPQGLPVP